MADDDRANTAAAQSATSRFPLLTDSVSKDSAALFAENLRRGAKPRSDWNCGIELELFGYDRAQDLARLDPAQVQRVLAGFAPSSSSLVFEESTLVEVDAGQMNRLTIEPGGQIEFSGAPQRSLKDVQRELRRFLTRLHEIADAHRFVFIAAGFDPLRTIAEQRWVAKMRYAIMRPYLQSRGARAWDMMSRTCAVQCNLDYGNEEDLAKKFLVGNRLAPIITAIFANSPFENGQASGYKSLRAATWLETDPDRTGIPRPALSDNFTPESFVEYAMNVPMVFAQRDGRYLDTPTGMRFGDFLANGAGPIRPVFGDWADHLTTIFTDARLKQHIELRSADSNELKCSMALQALWKGLLYDSDTLDECLRLAPRLSLADSLALREAVARQALEAKTAGVDVLSLAKDLVLLAKEGLKRITPDEDSFLEIVRERVLEDELSPADILLRNWDGSWHRSRAMAIDYLRVA